MAQRKRTARWFALAIVPFALTACGSGEHEDLKQWMRESTKDLKGRIPPLPEIKPFPVVDYDPAGMPDPFNATKLEPARKSGGSFQPDLNRRREPLEAYPLESLRMVGTLMKAGQIQALIQADRAVHQVRQGNYLGQNFGVVTRIAENEVVLKELIQDGTGDWVERTSTLQLLEKPQEAKK